MENPEIVYVDSYMAIGHYIPSLNRIEISKYFQQFPELCTFILEHEKKHSQIQSDSPFSIKHFWLEIKDRFRFFKNDLLFGQYRTFEKLSQSKGLKPIIFSILYEYINVFTGLFLLIRLKKIKDFVKSSVKTIWEIY